MDLVKFQEEVRKLNSLLENKQVGLHSWNEMLSQQIQVVVDMAKEAGISPR